MDNTTVDSCTVCALYYGPPVPQGPGSAYGSGPVPGGACSVVWAPDPVDNIPKECSGHGNFVNGACQCFFGSQCV